MPGPPFQGESLPRDRIWGGEKRLVSGNEFTGFSLARRGEETVVWVGPIGPGARARESEGSGGVSRHLRVGAAPRS